MGKKTAIISLLNCFACSHIGLLAKDRKLSGKGLLSDQLPVGHREGRGTQKIKLTWHCMPFIQATAILGVGTGN